ncbi:tetratricopeptide repeat protein [Herbaspirillum sp.]|uniref:YfgM family protein n=1 Tax=Herbaspirillum sp. TaxID=1890675 RepID=UPI0031DE2AD0
MAYDLEEQEQLDSIKAWWAKYGNLVTWALIIALAAYAAWTGWNTYQGRQSAQASVLYEEQQRSFAAKDNAKVQRAASDIQDKFSGTAYAEMSALVAARSAFDANDVETAKKQLQWVLDHGRGKEYKAIAAVRLAGVLLDAKSYEEALKVLSGDYPAQFAGAIADRKGDVLLAQGKRDEARTAYKLALEKSDAKDPGRQLIQIKLDAIGGEAPKA